MQAREADLRSLAAQVLARLRDVAPDYAKELRGDDTPAASPPQARWWVPEDSAGPPTTERVTAAAPLFTRHDVDLVLNDLSPAAGRAACFDAGRPAILAQVPAFTITHGPGGRR
jgi:hypothetical protein